MLGPIICCLFFTAIASAQGRITGTVADADNRPVTDAGVSLLNSVQAVLRVSTTDRQGGFAFDNIIPGTYEILVSHPGFNAQRQAIGVINDATAEIRITLEVRRISEAVTVTAETGAARGRSTVTQQVNVISEDAVLQRATAVLAQAAQEEAGISVQRTSPTIGAVLVRGLTEVGVFIDGVRFTTSTQRSGINTFFNLNDPSSLRAVEVVRGPSTAQYGSDSLGGTMQLVTRQPQFGLASGQTNGEFNTLYTSADHSFGANALLSYGAERFGVLANLTARRINTLRPGAGIDSHSAITRFLGLPSNITGSERLPDTAFTQYGGTFRANIAPTANQQLSFYYQRGQQDGGNRYDQLLGGDGNLIAELRNLMLDFFYARYFRQGAGVFDNISVTASYNSQREERVNQGGQGNPLAAVTHDKERTSSYGFSFYLDKHSFYRNDFLIGGDIYRDRVAAPSFSFDPAAQAFTAIRPRVPNGARYILAGIYVQDSFDAIRNRLRISGALRYNAGSYRVRSSESPVIDGRPLAPDDRLRVSDLSGRIGAVATVADGFNLAFNYSCGFRAPNITALGSTGLVGVGFQVAASDLSGFNATLGTTADERAVSTGAPVERLRSETSDNYDVSLRYRRDWIETELTGFVIGYNNTLVRQTLILPAGAVGAQLGGQVIERQNASGAVFVPLSAAPVLVQANFGGARMRGVEYTLNIKPSEDWSFGGNVSYIRAEDTLTGEPPNLGGGGLPPVLGFLRVRYQPADEKYWMEAYSTLAGRQARLSSLDLADRRTGAARSRANIQNFFRRGACIRGLTTPGANAQCGAAGGILIATGETLTEVQTRVLGAADSAPLFRAIPGYGLIGLRGGYRFSDSQEVTLDFANIADKSHRAPGWGVDGPGRSLNVRYRVRF
ncbi:MAG: TonB-dependent receptor [Acidobacteria bacterium]|nr:TonB-dependent receptor [Acidobacteriota bacterium]